MARSHSKQKNNRHRSKSPNDRGNESNRKWKKSSHENESSEVSVRMGPKEFAKKRAQIIEDRLGYTKESNPFGDTNLNEHFVWKKKEQYLQAAGHSKGPASRSSLLDATSQKMSEIEAVKKRREDRLLEERQLDEQRQVLLREKEQENYDDWAHKEQTFHLEQAKLRSKIRLDQGREKPLDLVAKGLRILDGEHFDSLHILDKYPFEIFESMTHKELIESENEIKVFIAADTEHNNFWKHLSTLCIQKQHDLSIPINIKKRDEDASGITKDVMKDIEDLLSSKTSSQLQVLESQVRAKLNRRNIEDIDPVYWETVATKIPNFCARAEIIRIHDIIKSRIKEINEKKNDIIINNDIIIDNNIKGPIIIENNDEDDIIIGGFSPQLYPIDAFTIGDIDDVDDDNRDRIIIRNKLINIELDRCKKAKVLREETVKQEKTYISTHIEDSFLKDNPIGMDEVNFSNQINLGVQKYGWEDKYKARKPRFFNRVKTGYEWNKYNQSHYDRDNPPPKTVQGYKFNIFYPDLIDPTVTPSYHLEASDDSETVIIRFHAGPPYEDIAFKIINREWLLVNKFGFRCSFERGILQLYFNFKRYRYRK
eukprot:GHVL01000205.1.p1 GENE.GHVL01000205.1~~GHVL01000205.1.p1  ORF type:complete len:595 (+),score=175.41 GHVL01000205.1:27-1811(+)